jgi:aryl-alcohol dehydrogenase-like predicted oxidoreductase
MGKGPNDSGASRKHIHDAIEQSLKNLKTSYIDVYIQHMQDRETPVEETIHALNELLRAGKIRYLGLSNFTAWQIQCVSDFAKAEHMEPFTSAQLQYNLLQRNIEWDHTDVCRNEGVGITAWSPLAGGWLTGKQKTEENAPKQGSRVDWAEKVQWKQTSYSTHAGEQTDAVIEECKKIAAELKTTVPAVALRWIIQRPVSSLTRRAWKGRRERSLLLRCIDEFQL